MVWGDKVRKAALAGVVAVTLTTTLLGCKTIETQSPMVLNDVTQNAIHTSEVQLAPLSSVPGTYEGLLPCADCSGIKTVYRLHVDGTYLKTEAYEGTNDIFSEKGQWVYRDGVLFLTAENDQQPYMLRAEVGQLRLLDQEGKCISGDLAPHYVLKKHR